MTVTRVRASLFLSLFSIGLAACSGQRSTPSIDSGAVTSSHWESVSAGNGHTVAVKTDGTLWAWGANYNGQLGNGTTTDQHSPVEIGSGFASASAGTNH